MPVREISTYQEDGDGLDFGEYWDDPSLVRAALIKLSLYLQPAKCYCLRFHRVDGGQSWFENYLKSGLATDPNFFPAQVNIPYFRLMAERDAKLHWPILGEWTTDGQSTLHSPVFNNATWHGQIRLKSS